MRCARCSTSARISSACSMSKPRSRACRRGSASSRPMPRTRSPRAARVENLRTEELAASARNVGYPVVGLVTGLSRAAGEAGGWTHWGATTQDIMDTATVLQVRDGLALIRAALAAMVAALAAQAEQAPPHGDGRAHASAAGAADHVRPEMRGVGAAADRPCPASRRTAPSRRTGELRRRRGHACVTRRPGHRGDGRPRRRTWPGRAGRALARQPRRAGRDGRVPRPGLRQPGEARHRRDPAGADRGRRAGGTLRRRPRLFVHHAAEAQPDRQRVHPRRRAHRACAGAGDVRRHGRRPRARHRAVAGGTAGAAASLRADARRAAARRRDRRGHGDRRRRGCGATSTSPAG